MKYDHLRGGHAPGHLRNAFITCIDDGLANPWYQALADLETLSFNDPNMQARWESMPFDGPRLDHTAQCRWLVGKTP